MVLLGVAFRLPVLTGEAEVLVDEELATAGVAGGEDGKANDDSCNTNQ